MSATDPSLRETLERRGADPALGVRRLSGGHSPFGLRSLVPPSPPNGGQGGGPHAQWLIGDTQNHYSPDPFTSFPMLCATTELFYRSESAMPLNADDEPLVLGDPFWIYVVTYFSPAAPLFLMGKLPNQNFVFALTLRFPGGTTVGPGGILASVAGQDDTTPPTGTVTISPPSPPPQTDWTWPVPGPGGTMTWSLARGLKVHLLVSVVSSLPFSPRQLGVGVCSHVGWHMTPGTPPANWGQGDTINFDHLAKMGFCIHCQALVSLPGPDWDRCPRCGATGSTVMKPVAYEPIAVGTPFGL